MSQRRTAACRVSLRDLHTLGLVEMTGSFLTFRGEFGKTLAYMLIFLYLCNIK